MYTMKYYSTLKETNLSQCCEVDEPRACYTEWSKSEREKQIPYIDAYIWNLEKWHWRTLLQGSKRDLDIENRLVTVGKGEDGMSWEWNMETYIAMPTIERKWEFAVWHKEHNVSVTTQRDGMAWEAAGRLKREETYGYLWLLDVIVWSQHNIVKQLHSN